MLKDDHKTTLIDIARDAVELEWRALQDGVREARQDHAGGSLGSLSVFGCPRG